MSVVIGDSQGRGIDVNNPLPVDLSQADAIIPMDLQSHLQTTIQTHNAVSVAATSGSSTSSTYDSDGFDKIEVTFKNDATTNSTVQIIWSPDNGTTQIWELLGTTTSQYKLYEVPTRHRYFSIWIQNTDTAAHTMSAWAYLKA